MTGIVQGDHFNPKSSDVDGGSETPRRNGGFNPHKKSKPKHMIVSKNKMEKHKKTAGEVLDWAEKAPKYGGKVKQYRDKARSVLNKIDEGRRSFRKAYRSDTAKKYGKMLDKAQNLPKVGKLIRRVRDKARPVLKRI